MLWLRVFYFPSSWSWFQLTFSIEVHCTVCCFSLVSWRNSWIIFFSPSQDWAGPNTSRDPLGVARKHTWQFQPPHPTSPRAVPGLEPATNHQPFSCATPEKHGPERIPTVCCLVYVMRWVFSTARGKSYQRCTLPAYYRSLRYATSLAFSESAFNSPFEAINKRKLFPTVRENTFMSN